MASGQVQVTFADLDEAAASTATTNRNIQSVLDDLYRMIAPLYEMWTGDASEQFQFQHQAWVRAADDMNEVLANIASLLTQSHAGYSETESAIVNIWAG